MHWFSRKKNNRVEFDEILMDIPNLAAVNTGRMEGKRELPISARSVSLVGILFALVAVSFLVKLFMLQVVEGEEYRAISDRNRVDQSTIIAERGVVYDRTGEMVIWNEYDVTGQYDFPIRAYTDRLGMGQLIGYVSYPQKDRNGFFYRTEYIGRTGVESAYNDVLEGENGRKIVEVDAVGSVVSEFSLQASHPGGELTLSVDAGLSEAMYQIISTSSEQAGFRSGAGAIMDIHTGEILALTSFPSYDPQVMADGKNVDLINEYNNDDRLPFLNKVVSGVYTPGSVVKPFVAYAALEEKTISPEKVIVSTGQIVIPNPYTPSQPSIFRDWRAHGRMTMREAIAFSSNVYFYIISGGFGDQAGMGITKMANYFKLFGLGSETGVNIAQEQAGVVPTPAWKEEVFEDDWRLGDTYFTSIGQYGFQTTPLQILRAYAGLASGGKLVTPHVVKGGQGEVVNLNLNPSYVRIIHEGMRMTVNYDGGTARSLERRDVAIAAKSGTAEVGAGNEFVNSWASGFWPYENPQYAFVLMMDKAPRSNALGATRIMGDVVEWIAENRPEYISISKEEE
ncbi:MAG: penicillin-binding transpeptidase domain-containing protein [Candidatus Paceibacteria bacterium]